MLDHIDKVVFSNERIELHGSVPVRVSANEAAPDKADAGKIEFCIEDRITRSDWLASRRAWMAEVTQQCSWELRMLPSGNSGSVRCSERPDECDATDAATVLRFQHKAQHSLQQ